MQMAFNEIAASVHDDAEIRRGRSLEATLLRIFLVLPVLAVIIHGLNGMWSRRLSDVGAEPPGFSGPPAAALVPPPPPKVSLPEPPLPPPPSAPVPRCYAYRRAEMREALRVFYGGTRNSKAAAEKALQRLSALQETDGGWSLSPFAVVSNADVDLSKKNVPPREPSEPVWDALGLTALATLSLLAEGETWTDEKTGKPTRFGENARKAVHRLLGAQTADTGRFGGASLPAGIMPPHAPALLAVTEAAGISGDRHLFAAATAGLKTLLADQTPDGGWRNVADAGRPDEDARGTVISYWACEALLAAKEIGLDVPEEALSRTATYFRKRTVALAEDAAGAPPLTPAAAALCSALRLGVSPCVPSMNKLAALLAAQRPTFKPEWRGARPIATANEEAAERALAFVPTRWFLTTQAFFYLGGKEWDEWNAALVNALPLLQEGDGSWRANDATTARHGIIHATALSNLALQCCWRNRR
jgi:hypothetical protein